MKAKRVLSFTLIFLLFGVLILEPKCCTMSKEEAVKIVRGMRAQQEWEATQQFKRFLKVLAPFLHNGQPSDIHAVIGALVTYFGMPTTTNSRKFHTGYMGIQRQVLLGDKPDDMVIHIHILYWQRSKQMTQRYDPFMGSVKLATKYDIVMLMFMNNEKLLGSHIECMR